MGRALIGVSGGTCGLEGRAGGGNGLVGGVASELDVPLVGELGVGTLDLVGDGGGHLEVSGLVTLRVRGTLGLAGNFWLEKQSGISNRSLEVAGRGVVVARDELAGLVALEVGAHLVEEGLALVVGLLACLLEERVREVGAGLADSRLLHDGVDGGLLGDELLLQGVQVGTGVLGELGAVVVGEGVDVHQHVVERAVVRGGIHSSVNGVLGLRRTGVGLVPLVDLGDLGVDGGVDLGQQRGVARDGDAELVAGEGLPLDGRDVGGHCVPDLEHVRLDSAVVADGIQLGVRICVEVARLLTTRRVGTKRLEEAHLAGRLEEELGVGEGGHALPSLGGGEVRGVRAVREGAAEVGVALRVTGHLCDAVIGAIGGCDVEVAIVEVLGGASLLSDVHHLFGVQAHERIFEVHVELQAAHVGVDGDHVGRVDVADLGGAQVDCAPLVTGQLHEDPGLRGVRDDDLVHVVVALLVNYLTEKLDAVTGGGGAAQHDVGDGVLAEAGGVVLILAAGGVDGGDLVVVVGGQGGGDAHARGVCARLGVRISVAVPAGGKVAHIGVTERRAVVRPRKVGLVRMERGIGLRLLDAERLGMATGVVLGTSDVGVARVGHALAHVDLRARERARRQRHHDGGGHGERLAEALEAAERTPGLGPSHMPPLSCGASRQKPGTKPHVCTHHHMEVQNL